MKMAGAEASVLVLSNNTLQLTAYSLRSAPASGSS